VPNKKCREITVGGTGFAMKQIADIEKRLDKMGRLLDAAAQAIDLLELQIIERDGGTCLRMVGKGKGKY